MLKNCELQNSFIINNFSELLMIKKLIMLTMTLCLLTACNDDNNAPEKNDFGKKIEIPSEAPDLQVYEQQITGKVWKVKECQYLTTDFKTIDPKDFAAGSVALCYFPAADKVIFSTLPDCCSTLYNVEYVPEEGDVMVSAVDADGSVVKGTLFRIVKFDGNTLCTLHSFVNSKGEISMYQLKKYELSEIQN